MSDLLIMALPLLGTGLLYTVILAGTSFMGGLVLGTLLGGLRAEQPPVLGKLAYCVYALRCDVCVFGAS